MNKEGYTHLITYERFNDAFGMWLHSYFYTEITALPLHQEALAAQEKRGSVRNIKIQEV